jgi:hypothetical protein
MSEITDTENRQLELQRQIEQRQSYWTQQKLRDEFRNNFRHALERLIHPVIVRLNARWRGDHKHPDGKVLRGYKVITDKYWIEESYEFTHCGRNGVRFILTVYGDEEERIAKVCREYSLPQYDKSKYCPVNTFLIRTEEEMKVEQINEATAKKLVTKGVWYARKIDLAEYLGPADPFYGHRYVNNVKQEDNYTSTATEGSNTPKPSF